MNFIIQIYRVKIFLICGILMLIFFGFAKSQSKIVKRIQAEHIYAFGNYITWPNDTNTIFYIGFLGNNYELEDFLSKIAKWRKLQEKPIVISHYNDIIELEYCHILCVSPDFNNRYMAVVDAVEGKQTLLVTERCKSEDIMINFFPENTLKKLEVNEDNIVKHNLEVSEMLYLIAKKYEKDWEGKYEEATEELTETKNEVKVKDKKIENLNTKVDSFRYCIDSQKIVLYELNNEINSQRKNLAAKNSILAAQQAKINKQLDSIALQESTLKTQKQQFLLQKEQLSKQLETIHKQETEIKEKGIILANSLQAIEKQKIIIWFFVISSVMFIVMLFYILRNYKIKKQANKALQAKNNEILAQNVEINQQKEEIIAQRDEIEGQKENAEYQRDRIEKQKAEITASIVYASRIQTAVLPSDEEINQILNNFFLLYKPRDIVSGDFYWVSHIGNKTIISVADCTGHGVPGAFMSMLGIQFFNEIVDKAQISSPKLILNELRKSVINALDQKGVMGETKDGMDIAVCTYDNKTNKLEYAGANNPMYLIRKNFDGDTTLFPENTTYKKHDAYTLIEIKADKMPIAIHDRMDSFTCKAIQLKPNDKLYLFSDGYADQFGGAKGKKFKYHRLKQLLLENASVDFDLQKQQLETVLHEWQGSEEQVDDIIIMGVSF